MASEIDNVRTGFVEEAEYQRLVAAGPPLFLRTLLELGRELGWRKGELLKLRVHQIDLQNRVITLPGTDAKNKKPRKAYMTEQIRALIGECIAGKREYDHVFTRPNRKPGGKPTPVREFRNLWHALCRKAGLGHMVHKKCYGEAVEECGNKDRLVTTEFALVKRMCPRCGERVRWYNRKYVGLLFHDLRRSAVRDLVRGGTPERVAMTITGHTTQSVFDRYNINSERDLQQVVPRAEQYRRDQRQALLDQENRYNSSTIASGALETAPEEPMTVAKSLPGTLQ